MNGNVVALSADQDDDPVQRALLPEWTDRGDAIFLRAAKPDDAGAAGRLNSGAGSILAEAAIQGLDRSRDIVRGIVASGGPQALLPARAASASTCCVSTMLPSPLPSPMSVK